ncbi:hypothetical protein GCM10027422_18170 [Hymenobacter arcticus]
MNKKKLAYGTLALGAMVAAIVIIDKKQVYPAETHPNPNAPAKTDQLIRINASPDKVWQLLSRIDDWAVWNSDITAPHLNGALQPGTSFDWKTGGLTIHSTLHTVEPNAALGWSGKAFGAFAIHNWTLIPHESYTEVRVEESMEGWLVRLLKPIFQPSLDKSIAEWLTSLKQAAEGV